MNWEKLKRYEDEVDKLRAELPLIKKALLYRQIRNADGISLSDVDHIIRQEMLKEEREKPCPV